MSQRRSAEVIESCFAATALAGAPLTEVPLPGDGGSSWVAGLPPGEILPLWAEARSALEPLGLHPVATTAWDGSGWVEARLFDRFHYGDDSAPGAVIGRSRTLSVEEALDRFGPPDEWTLGHWDEVVADHLGRTARDRGAAPEAAELADVPRGDEMALERRLLEWEEALRPTPRGGDGNASFGWFDPRPAGPVGLVLLPVDEPCHACAFLSFYGAEGEGRHEALIRLMCAWQQDFGALLVANWGTMLQFVASRPPSTLDEAFVLAAQHVRVAPCTALLPGESVRELARHLWRGERWFLHERP